MLAGKYGGEAPNLFLVHQGTPWPSPCLQVHCLWLYHLEKIKQTNTKQHGNITLICLAQLRDHYNLRSKLLREAGTREELVLIRIEFVPRVTDSQTGWRSALGEGGSKHWLLIKPPLHCFLCHRDEASGLNRLRGILFQKTKRLQLPAESTTNTQMARPVPPEGTEVRVIVKRTGTYNGRYIWTLLDLLLVLETEEKLQDSSSLPLVSELQ